jgi:ubiquinol-cytochrome c reductase cytochrome c subunit
VAEPEGTSVTDSADDASDVAALDDEFGFTPAVSANGVDKGSPKGRPARKGWRRRIAGVLVLMAALASMGGLYGLFASSSNADNEAASQASVDQGRQLYSVSCITCHGANLQGVTGRGPSLIGVGQSATYFQVSTGRMPATGQGAQENRKASKFTEAEVDALSAYVQSMGGGPQVPSGSLRIDTSAEGQLAEGGELFRLNCASCHGFAGKGAPLSAGKIAPSLNEATDQQIYAAMQSGPENMPVFSDNTLTPDQKAAIIAYVQNVKASNDPGGSGIDRIGPVSEAVVIWVGGVGALMIAILWIGARSR